MKKIKSLISHLLLLCFVSTMAGQSIIEVDTLAPDVYSTHYDSDNGLLQNTVIEMAFDNSGFLWIISEKGLTRFDGSFFKHFSNQEYEKRLGNANFQRLDMVQDRLLVNSSDSVFIQNGALQFKSDATDFTDYFLSFRGTVLTADNYKFPKSKLLKDIRKSRYLRENAMFYYVNDSSIYAANYQGGVDYILNDKITTTLTAEYDYTYQLQDDVIPMRELKKSIFITIDTLFIRKSYSF